MGGDYSRKKSECGFEKTNTYSYLLKKLSNSKNLFLFVFSPQNYSWLGGKEKKNVSVGNFKWCILCFSAYANNNSNLLCIIFLRDQLETQWF